MTDDAAKRVAASLRDLAKWLDTVEVYNPNVEPCPYCGRVCRLTEYPDHLTEPPGKRYTYRCGNPGGSCTYQSPRADTPAGALGSHNEIAGDIRRARWERKQP